MDNKIISFDLLKIEAGRDKICKCDPPHYEIDIFNHVVKCKDCGATVDPFEAMVNICKFMDKFTEYQQEAIKKIEMYRELANREQRKWWKNKAFKDMDANYKYGMFPHCPMCGQLFNPMDINRWGNKGCIPGKEK